MATAKNIGIGASPTTIVQTDSTAETTLAADTVTSLAAAVPVDAAAATATSIAAAVQATLTDPVATTAGWGASSEANFDAIKTEFDAMGTWATEMDLDYEALLVDVADIRTQFNELTTHATEVDLDFERLIVDVRDLKSAFNSVVDALQTVGVIL